MRGIARAIVLAIAFSGAASIAKTDELQPYQMVRSLQLLQDRIANGDHAVLPMQTRLLAIIDRRLRQTAVQVFEDPRNLDALLIYGASGGNPKTVERVLSQLELEGPQLLLGNSLLHYAAGNLGEARMALANIDPLDFEGELAASIALLAGTLMTSDNAEKAIELLDRARALAPGTLIEEAALRRSMTVCIWLEDARCTARIALQYVQRFLVSPYSSQFAEVFIAAVVRQHETIDLDLIEQVTQAMNEEQAHTVFLRIARASAIEGHERLLAFAARATQAIKGEEDADPRAILYANAASIASAKVEEALEALEGIDAGHLSPSDQRLLKAAKSIANQILSPPDRALLAQGGFVENEEPEPEYLAYVSSRRDLLREVDMRLSEELQ